MVSFNDLSHLLALIYIIPTFIMYGIILYTMFFGPAKKLFRPIPFYWLFGFSCIIFIIHTTSYFFVFRLTIVPALYPWLMTWPKKSWDITFFYSTLVYTLCANPFYNVTIAFNRFTIFAMKTRYNSFWKANLKYFLAFCVIGPLIVVWNVPFLDIENNPRPNVVVSISPTNFNFTPWWQPSFNAFIVTSISSILSLIMNLYVLYSILHLRFFRKNDFTHVSSQDTAMFAYSILIFLTEILVSVRQLMLTIDRAKFLTFALDVQFIAVDINDLVPAWFILATNKELRKEVIKLIFCWCFKKPREIKTTTVIILSK